MVCYAQCCGNTWMVWLSAMVLLGVGLVVYMILVAVPVYSCQTHFVGRI